MATTRRVPDLRLLLPLLLFVLLGSRIHAQPRTDVVILANGDRITGEVIRLERGRLEFKTDEAGTLYLEWDNISRLQAARFFEVGTSDGRRFLGSLGPSADRSLSIVGVADPLSLPMGQVTLIAPMGASFWRKLDGSIDAGFSYTRSSGVAQLNANSDTMYRKPRFDARLRISLTATRKDEDGGRDDRGAIDASYVRYRWARWFVAVATRFETNESLGIVLRSQVGGSVGPRLINSNRGELALSGGLVFNDERGVDAEPTQNIEALLAFRASYFTYDRPSTEIDLSLQYYPSLNDPGRNRLQFDVRAKQEFWKDLFVALTAYDSFDSRPPNEAFDNNDVGVTFSIGWSY
jgi:hypothetical protein